MTETLGHSLFLVTRDHSSFQRLSIYETLGLSPFLVTRRLTQSACLPIGRSVNPVTVLNLLFFVYYFVDDEEKRRNYWKETKNKYKKAHAEH